MTETLTVNGKTITLPTGGDDTDVPADLKRAVVGLKPAIEAKANKVSAGTVVTIAIPGGAHARNARFESAVVAFTGFASAPVVVAAFTGYKAGQLLWALHTTTNWTTSKTLEVKAVAYATTDMTIASQQDYSVALVVHAAASGASISPMGSEFDEAAGASVPVRMAAPAATYHLEDQS